MNRGCLLLALASSLPLPAAAVCWQPEVAASSVTFVAQQAGAPVEGRFGRFDGLLCLDEAAPGEDKVLFSVETGSVDMGMPEFDAAMRGPDFLDSSRWPVARFVSHGVQSRGAGHYVVAGSLTIRDKTRDIEVPFRTSSGNGRTTLSGETVIRRLDHDLGLGEWSDTRWIGADVTIKLEITLTPRPASSTP